MKDADEYLRRALRLVRGARDEAFAGELDHLERAGLSPDEAARALRRSFTALDDATLRRHAALIDKVLQSFQPAERAEGAVHG